jgi:DNA-binding HxlR family transcriptional regulator
MKDHHGCPVQASINVMSGKWKVQILWHPSFGPHRFALNAEGKKLVPLMETLCDWGSAHFGIKHNLPRHPARS